MGKIIEIVFFCSKTSRKHQKLWFFVSQNRYKTVKFVGHSKKSTRYGSRQIEKAPEGAKNRAEKVGEKYSTYKFSKFVKTTLNFIPTNFGLNRRWRSQESTFWVVAGAYLSVAFSADGMIIPKNKIFCSQYYYIISKKL